FKIIDSGEGIPVEKANQIFTPLFTTKDFGKGSGLGLSLSGMLAKKNDALLIYDKQAKHTTFVIKCKIIKSETLKLAA
ncbi:ATP-binding protein, partial [Bacteriovorax sp. DB6_IX]|uniref:ATP-binding protein n=1 Tax=Bacteriovorax sp. DB6_IX TaxID=1353530 RepID=UPI00038A4FFE